MDVVYPPQTGGNNDTLSPSFRGAFGSIVIVSLMATAELASHCSMPFICLRISASSEIDAASTSMGSLFMGPRNSTFTTLWPLCLVLVQGL